MKKKIGLKLKYTLMSIFIIFTVVAAKYNSEAEEFDDFNKVHQSRGEWTAPAFADKLVNKMKDLVEASKKGKEIFDVQCAICHGPEGKGDGEAGMTLTPRPANLTSEKVQSQSDGALYWKITTGNPPMAAYKGVFSREQRWQLVTYIRTLGKNKSN